MAKPEDRFSLEEAHYDIYIWKSSKEKMSEYPDKMFVRVTIIIITLFQEDNISGTNASLTYGPQIQTYMCLIITKQRKLFTICTEQVRSPYTEHAASGLPNPTRLWGRYEAQDQQVLPHAIQEW